MASSSSKSTTSSCLTCFASIPAAGLPKCIVHSCCGRPVCAKCLVSMPRLATFCPFCEDVTHAFRKGPRDDVIRAGQTVFDVETAALSSLDESAGVDEDLAPPPAYAEKDDSAGDPSQSKYNDGKFIIEDDEDDDGEEGGGFTKSPRPPRLLQRSLTGEKNGPAEMGIDRKEAATSVRPSPDASSFLTSDSLRHALSMGSGRPSPSQKGNTSMNKVDDQVVEAPAPLSHLGQDKSIAQPQGDSHEGLTRQFWLRPSDTLISLSLRFRVNAAALCKLNDLPLSTATTTPHLIHTRQFLLIPEGAVQSALSSGGDDSPALQSALDGPVAQTRRQKIQRARWEAESRFRAIITKNETMKKGKGRAVENGDVTLCDDRAARAYISLMEEELRFVDFGDGDQFEESVKMDRKKSQGGDDQDRTEDHDASVEAGRREKYDMIVKQAICRWEMDCDWERKQRSMGITPVEVVASVHALAPSRGQPGSSCNSSGWLQRWTSPSGHFSSALNWPEKSW